MIASVAGYEHPLEHLSDELKKLDIILDKELLLMNAAPSGEALVNEIPGIFMSASEAKSLLDEEDKFLMLTYEQEERHKEIEHTIASRILHTKQSEVATPLITLEKQFQLDELQIRSLIVAVAPHANRRYDKFYGYLQGDPANPQITLDLLLRLCCTNAVERRRLLGFLTSSSGVFQSFFVRQSAANYSRSSSILSTVFQLHERMVHYLLGLEWRFKGSLGHIRLYHSDSEANDQLQAHLVNQKLHDQIIAYSKQMQHQSIPIIWMLHGPSGSGKTYEAQQTCNSLGRKLMEWDMSHAPEDEHSFAEVINWMLLEASLQDAIPAFDQIHRWQSQLNQTAGHDRRMIWFMERLAAHKGLIFIMGEEAFKPDLPGLASASGMVWLDIPLSIPDLGERVQLWKTLAGDSLGLSSSEAGKLAGKFLFTPGKIKATVEEVRKLEQWRRISIHNPATELPSPSQLLHQAAYQLVNHRLKDKAVKMESRFGWDDLVLPLETVQLLRQACSRVHLRHTVMHTWGFDRKLPYGQGISMLFTGPPGTGKTMSATVMAKAMDAELYRIDLSRVVSKYIGETEKNLSEIFDQAKLSGAILFFDEADALFGKRSEVKDAHDKYANMETAYLLQKMEEYGGLTILATNFAQNLDDAFTRRIQYIIKYPFPDAVQREQLWRTTFPKALPVEEIDYPFLAQTFELSGGSIKNIVLTAAYLAAKENVPVSMKLLVEAVIQEYKKTGKVLLKDRLGAYAD